MGPLNEAMKKRETRGAGRPQVRHRLDDARRVPGLPREEGRVARTWPRSSARPPCASTWSASTTARPRRPSSTPMRELVAARDGGGRAGHRLLADLRARLLRQHRGADRAVQGGGALPGEVHLAPAQRGRPAAGGGRRADPHQPRGRAAGRDLPPQGGGRGQLAEDGRRPSRRSRPRAREGLAITADMYTYTAGATGFDACVPPLGAGGRLEALFRRLQDPPTRARILEEMTRARQGLGEPLPGRRARPSASCSSGSRPRR